MTVMVIKKMAKMKAKKKKQKRKKSVKNKMKSISKVRDSLRKRKLHVIENMLYSCSVAG
jgi:L-lactate utilization protein LutB